MRGDAVTGNGHRQPPRAHHEALWVFTCSREPRPRQGKCRPGGPHPQAALQGGKDTKQRLGCSLSPSVWTASLEGPEPQDGPHCSVYVAPPSRRCRLGARGHCLAGNPGQAETALGGQASPMPPHSGTSHRPPPDAVWVHVCVRVRAVRGACVHVHVCGRVFVCGVCHMHMHTWGRVHTRGVCAHMWVCARTQDVCAHMGACAHM